MKREIKFRAWFKEMNTMLDNVAIYPTNMIGMSLDDFACQLPEDLDISDSEIRNKLSGDGESGGELLGSYLEGDEWVWLEEKQYVLLQYIGRKDINGSDVYEGDIVEVLSNGTVYRRGKVAYDGDMCLWKVEVNSNQFIDLHFIGNNIKIGRTFRIIGNIYENPELINL